MYWYLIIRPTWTFYIDFNIETYLWIERYLDILQYKNYLAECIINDVFYFQRGHGHHGHQPSPQGGHRDHHRDHHRDRDRHRDNRDNRDRYAKKFKIYICSSIYIILQERYMCNKVKNKLSCNLMRFRVKSCQGEKWNPQWKDLDNTLPQNTYLYLSVHTPWGSWYVR